MLYQFPEFLYKNRLWLLVKERKSKKANLMFSESQRCAVPGLPSGNRAVSFQCPRDTAARLSPRDWLCAYPPRGAVMLKPCWAEGVWQFVLGAAAISLFHGLFIERNQNKTWKGLICFHKWLFSTKPQMTLEFSLCEPYVFHRKFKQSM